MDQLVHIAKSWLGLESSDGVPPWTHLKFGVIAGVVFALVALIWKGSTLAIVMLAGWSFVGALNEWVARRSTS